MRKPGMQWATLAMAVGLALTAGCTEHKEAASKAPTTSTTQTTMDAADALACDSAQTILGRMAAGTARWSPTLQPFDAKASSTILHFANDLEIQGNTATSDGVQNQMHATALSFLDLTTAMSKHDQADFDDALAKTKVEYAALKKICPAS